MNQQEYLPLPVEDKHNSSMQSTSDMHDTPSRPRGTMRNKYLSRMISEEDEQDQEEEDVPITDIQLPSQLYQDLINQFPAPYLLPKSFAAKDDSPRSGGLCKFLKLTKFRGMDHGRSKFRAEAAKIEKIGFSEGISLRKIFKVINRHKDEEESPSKVKEPMMTSFGEVVYQRNP